MMKQDAVKQYLVCINGGSGVVFQPSDENYSYVLTCKHVFEDLEKYNGVIQLHYYDKEANAYTPHTHIKPDEGISYFPHRGRDIAILKVPRLPVCMNLLRMEDLEKYQDKASLFGFPEKRRRHDKAIAEWLREDPSIHFLGGNGTGMREGQLRDNASWDELRGQSGGGIFCMDDSTVGLMGIQNKVPAREETLGRIHFTPLVFFDEIVAASEGKLEPIYPCYIKSFRFLLDDVFKLKGIGLLSRQAVEDITGILQVKAKEVSLSDLTPGFIKDYFKGNELLLEGQEAGSLNKRGIWAMWMELLTILNIVKSKAPSQMDCGEIFNQVRLFYSDVEEDFWVAHLDQLATANYVGLNDNGLVLVASRVPAGDDSHELDLEKIPTINQLRKAHELHEMGKIGLDIGSGNSFPFERYRFKNISAFKENPIVKGYKQFDNMSLNQKLEHLKKVYEQLLA